MIAFTPVNGHTDSVLDSLSAQAPMTDNECQSRLEPPLATGDNGKTAIKDNEDKRKGRDHRGRFVKGNPGGPGNPFARRLAALRKALCEAVTEADIQALAEQMLLQARYGDVAAVKLLFAYAIGKPADAVDPDTLDFHEWQVFQKAPIEAEAARQVLNSVPASLFCLLLRGLLPHKEDEMRTVLLKKLQGDADKEPPHSAPR
jgi:hypothetical protein